MPKRRIQNIRDPNARLNHVRELPIDRQMAEVRESLIDIWSIVSPFYQTAAGDLTTSGAVAHELVVCTSTSTATQTISLHSLPKDGDRVTVKRQGSAPVTVDTAGSETIDGSASLSLPAQYDAPQMIYVSDAGEWVII